MPFRWTLKTLGMNIKELIEELSKYPPDWEVGGSDDMGCLTEIYGLSKGDLTDGNGELLKEVLISTAHGWRESGTDED